MRGLQMAYEMLGPHAENTTDPGLAWARQSRIAKQFFYGTGVLQAAPAGAITVYRHWFPNPDLNPTGKGAAVAADVIAGCGGFHPTYIELYVGIGMELGAGLERHVAFTREASAYAHSRGYKVAGFSFYVTHPLDAASVRYLADNNYGDCDILSMHSYWGQKGQSHFDAYHHEDVYNWAGGRLPPDGIIITECGRDAVYAGDLPGWLAYPLSHEQFLGELRQFNDHIMGTPYVKGATPFTTGPTPDWAKFEMDRLVPEILGSAPPPCAVGCHWDAASQACVNDSDGLPCGQVPPGPGGLTPEKVLIATGLAAGAILALTYALGQDDENYGESPPEGLEAYPLRRR